MFILLSPWRLATGWFETGKWPVYVVKSSRVSRITAPSRRWIAFPEASAITLNPSSSAHDAPVKAPASLMDEQLDG
jgi:hypothetical protein